MMSDERNTVMLPRVGMRIQVILGLRVMLDVDLAALYRVQNVAATRATQKLVLEVGGSGSFGSKISAAEPI